MSRVCAHSAGRWPRAHLLIGRQRVVGRLSFCQKRLETVRLWIYGPCQRTFGLDDVRTELILAKPGQCRPMGYPRK